jgi:cytochrome P450
MDVCPRFDPHDPVQTADPYPTYAALRRDAPVFHDPHLGVWVVCRYDDVLAAVKQPEVFSCSGALTAAGKFAPSVQAVLAGSAGLAAILNESDGPEHTRLRGAFGQWFNRQRIAGMEPHIRAIAGELIDGFEAEGKADLMVEFAGLLPGLVMCDLLGVPREDFPKVKAWTDDWLTLVSAGVPEEDQIRCARNLLVYLQCLREQFLDRQKNPGEDLMTVLLPRELGGDAELSLDEAIVNVVDFFAAGFGTTSNMIATGMATLFEHGEQCDRLRSDPTLLDNAVEEILRFASSVQGAFRVTTRPTELGGVTIPAGGRVFLLYGSANHDEARFENPEVFDIDRSPVRAHLTFSRGPHFCIGAALARMEIRIALELILARLPELRPVPGAVPRRLHHLYLSGYQTLPVEWDPS